MAKQGDDDSETSGSEETTEDRNTWAGPIEARKQGVMGDIGPHQCDYLIKHHTGFKSQCGEFGTIKTYEEDAVEGPFEYWCERHDPTKSKSERTIAQITETAIRARDRRKAKYAELKRLAALGDVPARAYFERARKGQRPKAHKIPKVRDPSPVPEPPKKEDYPSFDETQ